MSKPYVVKSNLVDGKSTARFATLKGAAKYVKDRWQGVEYMRAGNVFGTDYGVYTCEGFALSDIGKFWTEEEHYGGDRPEVVRHFAFFKEFGGDYDPALDPKGEGDFRVCLPCPIWDDRDFVSGWRYETLAVAKTVDEAFDKLALVNGSGQYDDDEMPGPLVIGPGFVKMYRRPVPYVAPPTDASPCDCPF